MLVTLMIYVFFYQCLIIFKKKRMIYVVYFVCFFFCWFFLFVCFVFFLQSSNLRIIDGYFVSKLGVAGMTYSGTAGIGRRSIGSTPLGVTPQSALGVTASEAHLALGMDASEECVDGHLGLGELAQLTVNNEAEVSYDVIFCSFSFLFFFLFFFLSFFFFLFKLNLAVMISKNSRISIALSL